MAYEKIFTPIKIRGLELDNRIIVPAMGTIMANRDGTVNDNYINYVVERAKNGALMFLECCSVYHDAGADFSPHLSGDEYIPGFKKLTDAVHAAGGKVGIQIYIPAEALPNGRYDNRTKKILAPEMLFGGALGDTVVHTEDIPKVVAAFGDAARRANEAGFDAIEIHNGHNYMLHQFLSPHFNHRDDGYGGSVENCRKLPLEVVAAVRANWPEEKPLFLRVSAGDDELYDAKTGKFDGLTLDDVAEFVRQAHELGVDVCDVSRGNFQSDVGMWEGPNLFLKPGFNLERALYIKEKAGIPVVAVGRFTKPEVTEKALEAGADFVAWGKAHLADPEILKKTREGRVQDIRYCLGCDQACIQAYDETYPKTTKQLHISCMRNPTIGFEAELKPDVIVNAIGSSQKPCLIPGGKGVAVSAVDVLTGKVPVQGNVVVIGGGSTGTETAMWAFEQPGVSSVTGIEQGPVFGNFESKGRGQGFRLWVRGNDAINKTPHPIKMFTDTTVEKIEAGKVTGHTVLRKRNRKTRKMEIVKDEMVEIPADVIVYAGGAKPNDASALYAAAYKYNIPCIAIGSAVINRDAVAAIHEGNNLGRML